MNYKKFKGEHPERLHAFDAETKAISNKQKLYERLRKLGVELQAGNKLREQNGGAEAAQE